MDSYKELKAEWMGILTQLWDAFGKPVNVKQLQTYAKILGDVPLGVLEHTISEVIKRHEYNSVPTIGEIQKVLLDLHPYYQDAIVVVSHPFRDKQSRTKRDHTIQEYQRAWRKELAL